MRVYVGKITSFHGVKGEIKIKSSFEYKEKAFSKGTHLIIDNHPFKIVNYRRHKDYEMILLDGFSSLNEVLFLKNKKVYKEKAELNLGKDEVLDSELLNYKVVTDKLKEGVIQEIFLASKDNKVIRICVDNKEYLIPYRAPFIKKIDKENKKIEIEWIAW